jgi:hypothetical protein
MKRRYMTLAMALLGLSTLACGSASKGNPASEPSPTTTRGGSAAASIASGASPAPGYVVGDDDEDEDAYDYWDDHLVRDYGRAAGTLDRQAIVGLVRRYFAVALAGDGVVACSMLSSKLAKQADLAAAVPRDYVSPDVSALRGKPCSQFMSLLFGQAHEQLAYADVASLEVTVVRVQGDRGLAVLAFRTASERYIPLQREHGTWKIDAILDERLP